MRLKKCVLAARNGLQERTERTEHSEGPLNLKLDRGT